MDWLNRILTDVFTITALFSVAVGTFLGYLNRKGEDRSRSLLFLSVLFLFLGIFVFFDNALAGYLRQVPADVQRRIPIMMLSGYGVFVFSILSLIEELRLNGKQRRPLIAAALLLSNAPAASFLILKNGLAWYSMNLAKPILILFGSAILFTFAYSGILLFRKKMHRDFHSLMISLVITGTGVFIYGTKVLQERNPGLYQTQTYLILVLFLLIFLFLLSRRSHLEFRELKELRKARELINARSCENLPLSGDLIGPGTLDDLPFPATERECSIIRKLCNGLLYKEIALELDISLSSVKKAVHGIYKKAGVQNRVELIKLLVSFSRGFPEKP